MSTGLRAGISANMDAMRPVARWVPVGGTCLLAVLLAGCDGNPGIGTVSPGAPDGVTLDLEGGSPTAVWIEHGESFAVVTMGSSTCPAFATEVIAEGDDLVSVTFGSSLNDPCTADLAPTTHVFDLPASVTSDVINVEIRFEDSPEQHTIALD